MSMDIRTALYYADNKRADGWIRGYAKDELRKHAADILPILGFKEELCKAVGEMDGLSLTASEKNQLAEDLKSNLLQKENNMTKEGKELIEKNKLTEEGVRSLSESSVEVVYRIFFGSEGVATNNE